jgi:hypothetical protein
MRMSITNNIKSTLPKRDTVKEIFKTVEERFRSTNKSLAETLTPELTTMKFDGTRGMHEHIHEMSNLAAKLKALEMNVDESFLVQFILNSMPLWYRPFDQELIEEIAMDSGMLFMFVKIMIVKILEFMKH